MPSFLRASSAGFLGSVVLLVLSLAGVPLVAVVGGLLLAGGATELGIALVGLSLGWAGLLGYRLVRQAVTRVRLRAISHACETDVQVARDHQEYVRSEIASHPFVKASVRDREWMQAAFVQEAQALSKLAFAYCEVEEHLAAAGLRGQADRLRRKARRWQAEPNPQQSTGPVSVPAGVPA